ncbi:MAG TPA: MmgE/PrpD family protein [Clostridia bacterium]|nr:MmgE/PrpD family protein [Clostridia bacterium]
MSEHFVGLSYQDIPTSVVDSVKKLVLDFLGVSLAGSRTESGRIAQTFALEMGGSPQVSLIGRKEKTGIVHAAFANAICAHSVELDDVDELALFHFGPPIVSAALATAEMVGASGKEFLIAVVAGCEMMARLSRGCNPSLRDRGFHTTPVCGAFGAAVASSKLLRLSSREMVSALGLAGAQASGLMEMYDDSMQKRVNPGPAARNGVTAALLARSGFTGTDRILEGERGFGKAFCDEFWPEKVLENLGEEIPVNIEFKPYACARPIHNAIDCALSIRQQPGFDSTRIKAIRVWRHPAWAKYHMNNSPHSFHEAQVSLPYSVAVALLEGNALLQQYGEDRLNSEQVQRLTKMVEVLEDPSLPRGVSCRMEVTMESGLFLSAQVDYPKGSLKNPMTHEELEEKAHLLGDEVVGKAALSEAIAKVGDLEHLCSVVELLKPVCLRS